MKNLLTSIFSAATILLTAQCPTITMPSTLALTSCSTGLSVMAVASYSSNITSRWFAPGNIPLASSGSDSSVIYLNYATTYTVEFTDHSSNCVVTDTIKVFPPNMGKPVFSIISPQNFTVGCGNPANMFIQIINASATGTNQVPNGGPVTYTLFPGTYLSGGSLAPGLLLPNSNYSTNACGAHCVLVRDNNSSCQSSFDFLISCSTVQPTGTLVVSPNLTVCAGSSATLAASGLTTYTWNVFNGISPSGSVVVVPYVNQMTFFVTGMDNAGCTSTGSLSVSVDSTCAMVWPGDCNRDGYVNNYDVFEIGLSSNNTGPARVNASNNFVAQKATLWNSTGTAYQDESHIDCNGDGVVNSSDTVAIFNNLGLQHSFKPTPSGVNLLSLQTPQQVGKGEWNVADIVVTGNNSFYGVAFDIDFDPAVIENAYLTYPASFLTSTGQNTFLRKADFTKGKIYVANVRNGGANVSGSGKIAELHYKIKSTAPIGANLQLSISGIKTCNNQGTISNFDMASAQSTVEDFTGVQKVGKWSGFELYPNPASTELNLRGAELYGLSYQILDLSGRLILNGQLSADNRIDVTPLSAGSYVLKLSNADDSQAFRVQIVR